MTTPRWACPGRVAQWRHLWAGLAWLVSCCVQTGCTGHEKASPLSGSEPTGDRPALVVEPAPSPSPSPPRIALEQVAQGLEEPTDLQFVPGQPNLAVIAERKGTLKWVALDTGKSGPFFSVPAVTASEQGVMGLAFHPGFARNGTFYLNYIVQVGPVQLTRIKAFHLRKPGVPLEGAEVRPGRRILQTTQTAPHRGGQMAFGPDAMLYIALGSIGSEDPHDDGLRRDTLLGSILRIDVDRPGAGKPYGIPADNPYVANKLRPPEVWAHGLRNPWKFSFDGAGRLIAADVGEDRFEELSIVTAGANMGWPLREGFGCFPKLDQCQPADGLREPFFAYERAKGRSITGGYVYEGSRIPSLRGKYVFGDYTSGGLWATDLPDKPGQRVTPWELDALGISPSTFGRDEAGEIFVADYMGGVLYRLVQQGDEIAR